MTACDSLERASDYALGVLSHDETSAFEGHLHGCPACRAEVAALREVVGAFAEWPADVLRSPPLWARVAQRIGAPPDEVSPEPARWADEPPWRQVAPGIWCKLLATDADTGTTTMLVRLEPGVHYPPHTHAGVEELHLLDGRLWIDDRELAPGDYNRAEPGTADRRVWSETGCTCVLVTSSRDVLA